MKDTILLAALSLVAVGVTTALGFLSRYLHAKAQTLTAAASTSKAQALLGLAAGFVADGVDVATVTIQRDTAAGVTVTSLPALATDLAAKLKTFLGTEGLATLEKGLGLAAGTAADVLTALVTAKVAAAASPKSAPAH